jgi:hypothetical protein
MGSPVHSGTGDRPCTAPRSDLTPHMVQKPALADGLLWSDETPASPGEGRSDSLRRVEPGFRT